MTKASELTTLFASLADPLANKLPHVSAQDHGNLNAASLQHFLLGNGKDMVRAAVAGGKAGQALEDAGKSVL